MVQDKIDIAKLTTGQHQALACMFFAMLPGTDERYQKRRECWEILQKRFNKKANTYKFAKDTYDAYFPDNGRAGWKDGRSLSSRGADYQTVYDLFHDRDTDVVEQAVEEIISLYRYEKSSFITMKCGFADTVHAMLRGEKEIVISGIYTLQEELFLDRIVFVTLGGDRGKKEVDWQPGFFGVGHVIKEPYDFDDKGRYFKFVIHMDCVFGKIYKREDFLYYLDAFDARYIGPELTRDPSQAVSSLEDHKAAAVIRGVLDRQPQLLEPFRAVFPPDFMERVLGTVRMLAPVEAEFGETPAQAQQRSAAEFEDVSVQTLQQSTEEPADVCGQEDEAPEDYTADDFLREVFMTKEEYELLTEILLAKKNLILQGAPGVGKTFMAKRLAYSILKCRDQKRVQIIQFHQSYSYEDFVVGYRPDGNGFSPGYGPFYQFCRQAERDRRPHFFIIDEINRGNLSRIFGELFMLIESDKRGESLKLLYTQEDFSVPENVYLIGLMNTADRSLAFLDYALRRRFVFYNVRPAFGNPLFEAMIKSRNSEPLNRLCACVKSLNEEIRQDSSLGSGFEIGHSYFCAKEDTVIDEKWVRAAVEYELIPLIQEYWFDDSGQAEEWTEKLRGVYHD